MINYSEDDYKNAVNILRQCKNYVKNIIAEHGGEYPCDLRLLKLGEQERHYHRGRAVDYLMVDAREGLTTRKFCADGSSWGSDIHLTNYAYAYNPNERTTIELAIKIADNWSNIKDKITRAYAVMTASKNHGTEVLTSFTI